MIRRYKDTPLPGSPRPTALKLRQAIKTLSAAIRELAIEVHALRNAIFATDRRAALAAVDRCKASLHHRAMPASADARQAAFWVDAAFKPAVDTYAWRVLRNVDMSLVRSDRGLDAVRRALNDLHLDPTLILFPTRPVLGPDWTKVLQAETQISDATDLQEDARQLDELLLRV